MYSGLCRWIDRCVIRYAAAKLPKPAGAKARLEQAAAMVEQADFFYQGTEPAKVELLGGKDFRFASPIQTATPENNMVYGRISRCGKRWRQRPAVVLVHGWNDQLNYRLRFPSLMDYFTRRGVNSVVFELPYHFRRRSPLRGNGADFISEDVYYTVEATKQALAEINGLVNWLHAQGLKRVGVWGFSLGAWLAGLASCHNPGIACLVLITPMARVDRMVQEALFCQLLRRGFQGKCPDFLSKLNLVAHRPLVPKINILLVEALHDVFVPKETVEELGQAWEGPEIWRLPHGHITVLGSTTTVQEAVRWLGPRLRWGY
jgi:dienelactone hydrolase